MSNRSLSIQPDRKRLETTSWFAVVRAYQECTRRYGRLLSGLELTIPQFDVLTAVDHLGDEATPKAIAERLVVTRGNITGLLQRLQDKGLLTSRFNERDGRSFFCLLTADGQRVLELAQSAASLFIERQLSPFDDEELTNTERIMHRMRLHLETMDTDSILARTDENASLAAETLRP